MRHDRTGALAFFVGDFVKARNVGIGLLLLGSCRRDDNWNRGAPLTPSRVASSVHWSQERRMSAPLATKTSIESV